MPRAGNALTTRRPANSGRRLSRREAPVVVAGIGAGILWLSINAWPAPV